MPGSGTGNGIEGHTPDFPCVPSGQELRVLGRADDRYVLWEPGRFRRHFGSARHGL